jgi:hypothetical protein
LSARIEFEAPLYWLFDGVEDFVPTIYWGLKRLEIDKPYEATLKYSTQEFPRSRKKNTYVAVYALLYENPSKKIIYIKFGSYSLYYNTAGLIWAQAPLYARIIGVFRLDRSLENEQIELLERTCVKHLIELNKMKLENIKYSTKSPRINSIISMWMSVNGVKKKLDDLIDRVEEIVDECFDRLSKIKWIEPIYSSNMWFTPPLKTINVLDHTIEPGIPVKKKQELQNKEAIVLEGSLTITPMGLCLFQEFVNGAQRIYVDRCRNFFYNFEVLMK